jgi:hypothetical protein
VAERLGEAPQALCVRVLDAVRGGGEEGKGNGEDAGLAEPLSPSPFSLRLRAAAERLLAETRSAPPSRDTALTLLAADALITLAVEAELDTESRGAEE